MYNKGGLLFTVKVIDKLIYGGQVKLLNNFIRYCNRVSTTKQTSHNTSWIINNTLRTLTIINFIITLREGGESTRNLSWKNLFRDARSRSLYQNARHV